MFTISAITLVPALSVVELAWLIGVVGAAGLACALRSAIGIARPSDGPGVTHWSDFWLYGAAPVMLYAALLAATAAVGLEAPWAAMALAAVLLALLLLGIRNAWDTVTWIASSGTS